jgi:hypothetical protein
MRALRPATWTRTTTRRLLATRARVRHAEPGRSSFPQAAVACADAHEAPAMDDRQS